MAMMNLGMGFAPQRVASTTIKSEDEYAAAERARQQAYRASLDAMRGPLQQTPDQFLGGLANTQAQRLQTYYDTPDASVGYTPDGTIKMSGDSLLPLIQRFMGNNGTGAALDGFIGADLGQQFRDYTGAFDAQTQAFRESSAPLMQANAAASSAFQQDAQQRAQAQTNNQQAYGLANGGGFSGGILNDSYSTPFGNVMGGGGFAGGMMGSGQAASPSTGLAPTGPAAAPASGFGAPAGVQQSPQGWGGPFSNKNPWSLS